MKRKRKFFALRVFPHGWTGNSINELNGFLKDGWEVKKVIACNKRTDGDIINDYILFKYIDSPSGGDQANP